MQGVFPLLSLPFEQCNLEGFRIDAWHAAALLATGLGLVASLWAGALPRAPAGHHLPEAILGEKCAPCGWFFFWAGWSGLEGTEDLPPVQAGIVLPNAQGF